MFREMDRKENVSSKQHPSEAANLRRTPGTSDLDSAQWKTKLLRRDFSYLLLKVDFKVELHRWILGMQSVQY
jgi:hypothetical protein